MREGTSSDINYGDWLLNSQKITQEEYDAIQNKIKDFKNGK